MPTRPRASRRAGVAPRAARAARPTPSATSGGLLPSERWARRVGIAVVASATAVLAWTAFVLHPVGDYYTESDFYGWYAQGAELIRRGQPDPGRYPVVGPGFDAAVAAARAVTGDGFTAAKLVSVVSAASALALWLALLTRRLGPWAAAWSVAFMAAVPVFGRYAYSSTTDMLCASLQAGFAFALFGVASRWGPPVAGGCAALAALTRYNAAVLLPVGVAYLAVAGPATARRAATVGGFVAAFAVVAGSWSVFSIASGHAPGASLFRNFAFYSRADASRNVQDAPETEARSAAAATFADVVRRDPIGFGAGVVRAIPEHLARDARELLGGPATMAATAGAAALLWGRAGAPLLPVALMGASLFGGLLLAFYSDRYSLALVPIYAAAIGGLATPALARRLGRTGIVATWAALAVALALTGARSAAVQRDVLRQMPLEVVPAGRAIAAEAGPGTRVISRKGHVGYYAGVETVAFPRWSTLEELGAYAREANAGYLYYSWYECFIRPEFAYLLDPTAEVPGLTPIFTSRTPPAVVFRIGPEFGRVPAWMRDPAERAAHDARARLRVVSEPESWSQHIVLAAWAARRERWDEVLREASLATRAQPDSALGWTACGDALRHLGRWSEARTAYTRAIQLDATDADARIGLGWVELLSGNSERAAELWRPVTPSTRDTEVLSAMAHLYERLGDQRSLSQARDALRRIGDTHD